MKYEKGSDTRKADYPVDKIFLDRWSPRAMSGETISEEELFTLFEAARWAPSDLNEQPWRFIYAYRDTKDWDKMFEILADFNKMWCKNAAVIICLISKKTSSVSWRIGQPYKNHMSDAGAAWENLALQGSSMGLVVHGMAGYDIEKARKELKIPDDYEIVHIIAVGKPGDISVLDERMQKAEKPNDRKHVKEFVFRGQFKENR